MTTWREVDYDSLLRAKDENVLFRKIAAAGKELGYDFCSYGIKIPVPISRPAVAIFDTYPAGWIERYRSQGYLDIDPTVRHGASNNGPIIWGDETFASARNLWDDARDYGLRVGWAQSARDMGGAFGLLSLSRSADPLTEKELRARRARMFWLVQAAHAGMNKLLRPKLVPEALAELTRREMEVLRWTAEGKTAFEIGQILSISGRTVNFHVNNVCTKLKATNKIQAAVKAITLGLLDV
jgi:LuxR family transcriptional regulator, quorum-sensing system regulator SolR